MKSRIKEQGSAAHIVIIVILVVAVLGLLGFVLWQNFIQPALSTTPLSTSQETAESDTAGKTNITITEWGVKGSFESDLTLTYKFDVFNDNSEAVSLNSENMLNTKICKEGGYGGFIDRYMADETVYQGVGDTGTPAKELYESRKESGKATAHVGDYYYFITFPQAACAGTDDPAYNDSLKAWNATIDFVKSLTAV